MGHLEGLLDTKNTNLWNELNNTCSIEVKIENRPDYGVFSQNRKYTIHVQKDNINPASFAHELLHIYLKTKNVTIGGGLTLYIKGSPSLSRIFSENLLDHISNSLEHVKMIPIFLDLGYKIYDFISDYHESKLTDENLSLLKKHFQVSTTHSNVTGIDYYINKIKKHFQVSATHYNATGIDYYIGIYFAAKACPNQVFNYSIQLNELKQFDPDLFNILESFWESWGNYDYTEKFASHHSFLIIFTEGLERWVTDKKITY